RPQRAQRKRGREGMGLSWTLFNLILFLLDLFFFTAEAAESAEEEGKRGDGFFCKFKGKAFTTGIL
ncbi:MAG: hypothetical protein WBL95_21035, partial [Microcoleus sp.]